VPSQGSADRAQHRVAPHAASERPQIFPQAERVENFLYLSIRVGRSQPVAVRESLALEQLNVARQENPVLTYRNGNQLVVIEIR